MADLTLDELRARLHPTGDDGEWFARDELALMVEGIDAAIKQRERDAKNAARYRWLRDGDNDLYVAKENAEGYAPEVFLGSDLDDELDITMTQENPNE